MRIDIISAVPELMESPFGAFDYQESRGERPPSYPCA